MHYACKRHIYSLYQNLSLNVNSINEKKEASLYYRKIRINSIKKRMNILKEEDIKVKQIIYNQYKDIFKPFIYNLILVYNFFKDSL